MPIAQIIYTLHMLVTHVSYTIKGEYRRDTREYTVLSDYSAHTLSARAQLYKVSTKRLVDIGPTSTIVYNNLHDSHQTRSIYNCMVQRPGQQLEDKKHD